jgi:hypothetical protein
MDAWFLEQELFSITQNSTTKEQQQILPRFILEGSSNT